MRRNQVALVTLPVFVVSCGFLFTWYASAAHEGDRYLPYAGTLELDGMPVSDSVDMTFVLENQAGDQLDSVPLAGVVVSAGRFAVDVGPVDADTLAASPLFLRVFVGGTELGGRQEVRAVGRSVAAETATGDFVVNGAVVAGTSATATNLDVHGAALINADTGAVLTLRSSGGPPVDVAYQGQTTTWEVGSNNTSAPGGRATFYWYRDGYRMTLDGNGVLRTNGLDTLGDQTVTGDVAVDGNVTVKGTLDIGLERKTCEGLSGTTGVACTCPTGKRLLGGGAYCFGNNEHVNSSHPESLTTWRAWCEDVNGANVVTQVSILCGRI